MDKTVRCVAIDDEPLAAQLIGSYVDKTPFMELAGIFQSAQEAIKIILEGKIDVVFLDIQMPQLNGLEFAKIIPPPPAESSLLQHITAMQWMLSKSMPLIIC